MANERMADDSGSTTSVWMSTRMPELSSPVPDRVDVCVIGAGIAGLGVARALALRGVDVCVIDHGAIGGGQTGRTSAHLTSALDDRFYLLRRHFGAAGAKLAATSHAAAIDEIERLVRELDIACELRRVDGYLFAADAHGQHVLERELVAARDAGLDVGFADAAPLPFATGRALRFANQAEFHPLAFLAGLAKAVVAAGGRICTGVNVTGVEGGAPPKVTLDDGRVLAPRAVVDATNTSISSWIDIPIRTAAYRSYILAFEIPHDTIPHALYWDTEDPYHYVRVASDANGRDVLVVGGADHRVGQGDPEAAWESLLAWTRPRFTSAGAVVARWSGQISEPADGLGLIGALPKHDNIFVVTGDSGEGLTHGMIAALMLPALIAGESHPWAELYAPARTKLHGVGTLLHEAMKSNLPFRDWISPGDVESVDQIAPGQGATVRRGIHLLAVHRDAQGTCHVRSARCPHLGAAVRWNAAENTWDCPAHGSRFDPCGKVLNGPSSVDLAEEPK